MSNTDQVTKRKEDTQNIKLMSLKIGIDNGGVCSIHATPPADHNLRDGHHSRNELDMPNVVENLQRLKNDGHTLSLESFSGRNRAIKTRDEIESRFPDLFDAYHFTKDKKWKVDICGHLGLDIMIDDVYEVVESIAIQRPTMLVLWFQGDPSFNDTRIPSYSNVKIVKFWEEIYKIVTIRAKEGIVVHQCVGFLNEKEWNKRVYPVTKIN